MVLGVLASAVKRLYGDDIIIQRCLFHIKKFIIQKLSTKPKTDAARELLNITYALFDVEDIDTVEQWIYAFNVWCNKYNELLNERTYNKHLSNVKHQRKWWYTHKNLRAARSHLSNALDKNHLFSFIYHERIPPTSNHVEGGINSRIKKLIRCHNGQKLKNKTRMIEWYLWSRSKSHNFSDLV
jgi:hypothetical protein